MSGKAFWGPNFWTTKHYIALKGDIDQYESLIKCYKILLPCEKCKVHYCNNNKTCNLRSYNQTNETAFYHSYKLHDLVNKLTQKESPSFESVKKYFYSLPEDKYEESMWNVLYVCAATYSVDKAVSFKELLGVLIIQLSNKSKYAHFLNKWDINQYLTNNRDLFLYIYLLQQHVYKDHAVLSPYLKVKMYYFGKVGKECKECNV